jgi:hypothetical protein
MTKAVQMQSDFRPAIRYQREAERLRSLAAAASFEWAQDTFNEVARQYDQLADAAQLEPNASLR